jgi:hypothetical protein
VSGQSICHENISQYHKINHVTAFFEVFNTKCKDP